MCGASPLSPAGQVIKRGRLGPVERLVTCAIATGYRAAESQEAGGPPALTACGVSVNSYVETYKHERSVNRHPVHVDFIGGAAQSNGIAFEDYQRMGTHTHKLNSGRRGSAPDWAFNSAQLREIIVRCMEKRVEFRKVSLPFTDAERLTVAQKVLAGKNRPRLVATINKLCAEFMDAKKRGDTIRAGLLAQKVEETDTQLVMIDHAPRLLAGCVYYYYRLGLDSVAVGQQLGLKPPHVRGLLWKLGKVAGELGYGPRKPIKHRPKNTERARASRFAHLLKKKTWAEAKDEMGEPETHNGQFRRLLKKFGLWKPRHCGGLRVAVDVKKIARLREQGLGYQKIADELGTTYQTVRTKLKRAGLFKPHNDRCAFGKGRPKTTKPVQVG